MNRFFPSGAQVDCCATESPVLATPTWYHRTCATFGKPPLPTVCVSQRDWAPPRFVYWFCIIRRYESVSTLLPPSSGTSDGPPLKFATARFVGPPSVELTVFAQSTWNCHTRTASLPQIDAK